MEWNCRFPQEELNKLPCGVVAFENHAPWRVIHANNAYVEHYASKDAQVFNIYDEDRGMLFPLDKRLEHADSASIFFRADTNDGEDRRIVMNVTRYGDGSYLGVAWDATERSKMLDEMESEKEKFAIALCNSKNVVFEHNLKKRSITFYIPNVEQNTVETIRKQDEEAAIKDEDIHEEDREFFLANIYNPAEKMLAARIKLPLDDKQKWYRVTRQFEYDDNGDLTRLFGVMIDIDDEKKKERERQEANEKDDALGIYYRNAAVKKIEKYINLNKDRRDYALFVLDIDNFKNINDTYGHLYGDTVIEMVAHVLRDLRPNFSIPGRYGGDEFFMFLYSVDKDEIKEAADAILMKLLDFRLAGGETVTSSIGVVLGEGFKEKPTYKDMFEKADKALYAAKKNGKAQWQIFNRSMDESSGRAIDYEVDIDENSAEMESKDLMKVFLELSSAAKTNEGAIYSIIKYITAKFDFDWMQVMQVNSKDDLITVRYEWSRNPEFINSAGKSGYYVHSDIMRFRNYFEKHPVFEVIPENTVGFSPKFQREFDKNKPYNIIYISDTTADENFYMFTCVRFDTDNVWKEEEKEGLNVATKIMTMFISQNAKESERERELQKMVDYEQKTGMYKVNKFYEQLGRLRKFASERGEDIILFHIDIGNFLQFNRTYGYREGDILLHDLATRMLAISDADHSVSTRLEGTDIFFRAFRVKKGEYAFVEKCNKEHMLFCEQIKNKYPNTNIVIRSGVYKLKQNEDGGIGFDKGLEAKKKYTGDRQTTFYVWYKESDGE